MTSARLVRVVLAIGFIVVSCPSGSADPPAREFTPPTIGKSTTYLTGPLLPDGTVNYVAALDKIRSKGVTRENNAAVLLIQALGTHNLPEETRGEVLRRLGLEWLPEDGIRFDWGDAPSAGDEPAALDFREELKAACGSVWTREDHPLLAEWLKENEARLDLVVVASERSRFYCPVVSVQTPPSLEDAPFDGHLMRSIFLVRALLARALLWDAGQRNNGAVSDVLAAHRLAHLFGQHGFLIDDVVMAAATGMFSEATAALALSGHLSAEQMLGLSEALNSLPPMTSLAVSLSEAERLYWLDSMTGMIRLGTAEVYKKRLSKLASYGLSARDSHEDCPDVPFDADELLRRTNEIVDRMVAACRRPSLAGLNGAFEAITDYQRAALEKVPEDAGHSSDLGTRLLRSIVIHSQGMPPKVIARRLAAGETLTDGSVARVEALHRKALMHLKMAKCAVALRIYQDAEGHYPNSLADMVPEYLPQSPEDLLADKPLGYRRTEKGFVLHSVGVDAIDQTFDVDSPAGQAKESDDIIVEAHN
jgi:hypothetical protein